MINCCKRPIKIVGTLPFITFSKADKSPTEMSSDQSNIYAKHDAQYGHSSLKLKVLNTRLVSPHANNNFICLSLFCFTQHQKTWSNNITNS